MGTMTILTFLILFSLQIFAICDQDQVKSPHWVVVCGGSYLFSEDKKSWNDASDICELFGGHLAQSLEEDWWWHSGNDIEREGVYRQADRELILWTPFWFGGLGWGPDGGTAENCLEVHLSGDKYAGKWADTSCTNERYYICEGE